MTALPNAPLARPGALAEMADWVLRAACRVGDPNALFVHGAAQQTAKRICRNCPVRYECLAEALDNQLEWGVWGGMTESERRELLRRYPQVTSWRRLFAAARRAYRSERRAAAPKRAGRLGAHT